MSMIKLSWEKRVGCRMPSVVALFWLTVVILVLVVLIFCKTSPDDDNIATINVGVTPAGICITPDSRYAYVANNNNYGISVGSANADSVSVIDLRDNKVIKTIYDVSFNQPYTVTISKNGKKAYVTNSNYSTVTIINICTNTVSGVITGFDGPSGFVILPHKSTIAYVNEYGGPILGSGNGTTVSIVNLTTNTIVGTIAVGKAPATLAATPNGKFVYVLNYVNGAIGSGTISVIQTSNNTVVQTIAGFSGPFGIVISPNGRCAYVTNFGSNNFSPVSTQVSVVKLSTNTIIETITVGIQPSGIAISPNGKHVYVSNYNTLYSDPIDFTGLTAGQGTVNIIRTKTNKVLSRTIDVGQSPANIAIDPKGKLAYVTNFASNTVTVIDI